MDLKLVRTVRNAHITTYFSIHIMEIFPRCLYVFWTVQLQPTRGVSSSRHCRVGQELALRLPFRELPSSPD